MKKSSACSIFLVSFSAFVLSGCLAAAAGYGIAKATEGDDVYVCDSAPNATSKTELATLMEADSADYVDRSGERVEIKQKGKIEADGQTHNVVFVESEDFDDRRYWVPFASVCRSG